MGDVRGHDHDGEPGDDEPGDGGIRIGDAERHSVVDTLTRHAGAGRLTLDELAERAGVVFAARTRDDLATVLADLPADLLPDRSPGPGPPGHDEGEPGAGGARRRRRFVAIMTGSSTRGRWRAPRRMKALAFWGAVKIDLRDAIITSPEVTITARACMGGVMIIVPEGMPVDVHGMVLMGGTTNRTTGGRPIDGAPAIRVRARGFWGGVSVVSRPRRTPAEREERRRERERERRARRGGVAGPDPAEPGRRPDRGRAPGATTRDDHPDGPATRDDRAGRPGPGDPRRDDVRDAAPTPTGAGTARRSAEGRSGNGSGTGGGDGARRSRRDPALPSPSVDDVLPTVGELHDRARTALRDRLAAAGLVDLQPAPGTEAPRPGPDPADGPTSGAATPEVGGAARPGATATPGVRGTPDSPGTPTSNGSRIPIGTLTMLVTDIVGSTRHAEELGDQRWMDVLRAHNELVRRQVADHGGTEVKAQGDGFLCVFPSARRAILAAVEIQRAMARYRADRPEHQVELRIGLHTGEIVADDDDVHGQNVVVAVRVADAAAPSEILISGVTRELTASAGDLDAGEGRDISLKGISEVRRVHAVTWT